VLLERGNIFCVTPDCTEIHIPEAARKPQSSTEENCFLETLFVVRGSFCHSWERNE